MKVFDMHIHARNAVQNPEQILEKMDKAGVYGGCVFSNLPKRYNKELGTSFEERLEEIIGWTEGYEDRLFPIMRIHFYEDNIIENIRKAVDAGVCGFKTICADHYVYEERSLEVLREIAKYNKPVIFHSGILWDGRESSKYNRPVHWEALVNVEGLRFSMGHCSWPWIDECVALYGQFLNASNTKKPAEMFFDTTPGTPDIYREELFRKIYLNGYDTGHNVMFGTDCTAHTYSDKWASKWVKRDREILEELGVSKGNIENYYYNNLLRFLGKTGDVEHMKPVPDNAGGWTSANPEVVEIIEKWYKKLNFPKNFDREFYDALKKIRISDIVNIEEYDIFCENGKRNLLSFLFMCEKLAEKYHEKGIDEKILYDTLSDIVIWTNTWSNLKGEIYLSQLDWLQNHLKMKLFRLGRLQFCMAESNYDIEKYGVKKGDKIIEIHVPEGEPLDHEECLKSIDMAKKFFADYFPEFDYKCFTAHSWMLDETLQTVLKPESNILKFAQMFEPFHKEESDAILRYIFRWDTTRYNLRYAPSYNDFTQKIKSDTLKGKKFYEVTGILKMN